MTQHLKNMLIDNHLISQDIFVYRLLALQLQRGLCERQIGACTSYVTEEMEMMTRLQRLLHPSSSWCQSGGRFATVYRLYEKYCRQPLLRNLANPRNNNTSIIQETYTCEHCESPLGKIKPSVIFWAYTELYYFCSQLCRDKWLSATTSDCKSE